MRLTTAIITAPHRPRPTLNESLRSYRDVGGFRRVPTLVSADGYVNLSVPFMDVQVHARGISLGNFRNWVAALELALATENPDFVMVCEDDITWAKGAYERLCVELPVLAHTDLDVGAWSLYLPSHEERHIQGAGRRHAGTNLLTDGWHLGAPMGKNTWGAQCMVFSREQAEALLGDAQFRRMREDPRWNKNVDGIVARCLNDRGRRIAYRVPCLVNHDLGEGNSSLGYPDERPSLRTKYFTGVA